MGAASGASSEFSERLVLSCRFQVFSRPWRTSLARRPGVAVGILCASLTTLAACSSGGSTTSSTTPSASATGGVKADTSLCTIIAPKDFFAAIGVPGGTEQASTQTVNGDRIVNCLYKPSVSVGASSAINFVFTSDGATYYGKMKQNEQGILGSENDLSGLGDAAFWGTGTPLASDAFQLNVRKGNVIVVIEMDGSAEDGSVYLNSAKQFAQTILAHL